MKIFEAFRSIATAFPSAPETHEFSFRMIHMFRRSQYNSPGIECDGVPRKIACSLGQFANERGAAIPVVVDVVTAGVEQET